MAKLHKLWRFFSAQPELNQSFVDRFGISKVIAQVLVNRGHTTPEAVADFLHGGVEQLGDPWLLKDCRTAVDRIVAAIDRQEKIVIYGDYDVDGVTAAAVMMKVLRQLGANVGCYIPERQSEGYGIHQTALEHIIAEGAQLVISVDCGISAAPQIAAVKDRLDVIITDHHEPPPQLPCALAILNPKQADCAYPDKQLAGVGVAFKLCQAVWYRYRQQSLTEHLDLVAVGTVADLVPLTGENRILVKLGLAQLAAGSNIGLQQLAHVSGLAGKALDAGKIGYVLGPRLNAAGRLGKAQVGLELLLTDDRKQALEIAALLDHENTQRQLVEKDILAQAEQQLQSTDIATAKVLVVAGQDWHTGVIGIVASRLVERYYRPVVVIGVHDGIGKGSGRSIAGFDLYQALNQCADLLIQFGGHHQAAGLSVAVENINGLRQRLTDIAARALTAEDYIPILRIDVEVALEQVNTALVEQLACLEPFGMGNPSPMMACRDVVLADARAIGQDGRHLKFRVRRHQTSSDGIAWEMGGLSKELGNAQVNIAFQPQLNEWNGQCNVQLKACDIQRSQREKTLLEQLYQAGRTDVNYNNIGERRQFFTKVVGVTFDGRQQIVAALQPGQALALHREPHNAADANAIGVACLDGSMVGYLAAGLAKELAAAMDAGRCYDCVVTAVTGGGDHVWGVNILVFQRLARDVQSIDALPLSNDCIRKAILGDHDYHDSQQSVLTLLEAGHNVLAIMGTGRGKSAVFQTHAARLALASKKMSVIVYPLRALVNDQYVHLSSKLSMLGVRVFKGNGTLSTAERAALFAALQQGSVDVLLTTPEFAQAHQKLLCASPAQVGFFVVDECHHIACSAGQRPAYHNLNALIQALRAPLVLGVTATANDQTAAVVKDALNIAKVTVDKTIRSNLQIVDQRKIADKLTYLTTIVTTGEKTLVFVNSRKTALELAEQLCMLLPEQAEQIGFYHAGLSSQWRNRVEGWYRDGTLRVVIATSAFGEGVDFSDIRHVVQYHLAFNLTTFNQQCGRAGRDGKPAAVHLLFGQDDIALNERILQAAAPDRPVIARLYLLLKEQSKGNEAVRLSNRQIAELTGLGERTIQVGLRILEELQLIWRETAAGNRLLYLCPQPVRKRELQASSAYCEGMLEQTEFSLFAQQMMRADAAEILSWIYQPLYPQNV